MKWSKYTTDCSAVMANCRHKRPEFSLIAVDLTNLELEPHFGELFLSSVEQQQYEKYTFPKRRLEWLGGRLACKEAVAQFLGLECLQDIVVANTEHGKPFIEGGNGQNVQVSISHSGDFAMALACSVSCGLDLQEITPSLGRVEEKFVHHDEKMILNAFDHSEPEQLGLVWAIKEALRKQVQVWPLLGFLETRLEAIEVTADSFMVQCVVVENERALPPHLPVVYATMYKEHALALCFESKK